MTKLPYFMSSFFRYLLDTQELPGRRQTALLKIDLYLMLYVELRHVFRICLVLIVIIPKQVSNQPGGSRVQGAGLGDDVGISPAA